MEPAVTSTMGSKPRKWMLNPMSPQLKLTELRNMVSPTSDGSFSFSPTHEQEAFEGISITHTQASISVSPKPDEDMEDVVVVSRQVSVRDGDAWSVGSGRSSPSTTPGTPSSAGSRAGSRTGFYSFVDDPTSPEAEKNEEWMTAPERLAKLATLKEQNSYRLQTYSPERKPERLFEENNGDSRYRVENSLVSRTMAKKEVVNVDRREIIREQAPKKSQTFKEQVSSLGLDLGTRKLVDGFSISYTSVDSAPEPTPAEPGTIDEKQIDFDSARKQFLLLEQTKRNPIVRRSAPASTYTSNSPAPTYTSQVPAQLRKYMFFEESSAVPSKDVVQESRQTTNHSLPRQNSDDVFISNMVTVTVVEDQEAMKRSTGGAEMDSGLGDQLGGNTSDSSDNSSVEETPAERDIRIAKETPIEREIRIAQEREESLRKSRGIKHSTSAEMVEIKTKPLLSLSEPTPPSPARPLKAKESNRVSFLIHREIERDLERQESTSRKAGVEKGRGAVIYDVEERKKVFEPQVKSSPAPSVSSGVLPDVSQSSSVARDSSLIPERPSLAEASEHSELEEGTSPCCPHRHAEHTVLPVSRVSSASTSNSESSWSSRQRQSTAENQRMSLSASVQQRPAESTRAEGLLRASMGSFSSSSLSSLTDTRQDQEIRSFPPWRKHLEQRLQNAPDLIRQEIERDLQREKELLDLRESRICSRSLDTGLDAVDVLETVVTVTTQETNVKETASSKEENTAQQTSITEVGEPPKESVLPQEPIKPVNSRQSYSSSLDTYHTQRMASSDKTFHTPSAGPYSRLPSVSIVTALPWGSQKPSSPVTARGSPLVTAGPGRGGRSSGGSGGHQSPISPQKGLTETLLEDFEEHRAKLKLEENAYAGIQPTDSVNNEVLEATRVTRHKNTRALQWEAGVYANEDAN